MAVNKVVLGSVSIIDITDSTVTPETLGKGATAYDKSGEKITGTMEAKADPVLQEKTVTPSTSQQSVTPDSGYDGLSKVMVEAIPINYEDVGAETNAYTTKIGELETAITALETELEGKASGGSGSGSVETCTVTITTPKILDMISYTQLTSEGVLTGICYRYGGTEPSTITLTNVVCGSMLSFINRGYYIPGYTTSGATKLAHFVSGSGDATSVFTVTAGAGETATIDVYNDN